MTIVAMWCRHKGDNLIGIDGQIPWNVASDTKHFLEVVEHQTVVCGRKTYESLPGRTIEGSRMYILTHDALYETADKENHFVILGQKALIDSKEDLYIAGGALVYEMFLNGKERLKPDIIVDCVYEGDIKDIQGTGVDITNSVKIMEEKYRKISFNYCSEGVVSAIWIMKGRFVEQGVLKRIRSILAADAEAVF